MRVYESDAARLSGPFNNIYEGPVRHSRPLGNGKMEYIGESGPGMGWPVGTRIEGHWAIAWRAHYNPSQPQGRVVAHLPNGFAVGGTWLRDQSDRLFIGDSRLIEGPGFVRFPNGENFTGDWSRLKRYWYLCYRGDCQSGSGATVEYLVREFYLGEFQDGRAHGHGVRFRRRNGADHIIFAGEFADGETLRGTFYCRRGDTSCLNLLANRRESPDLKIEWVDRFGFFQSVDAPLPAELEAAAEYLAGLNPPASGGAK
ncbi:MAG: hypothetical protein NXI24_00125 [bacterium]|nr:hypothetical protein [bacterium]